MITIISGTNRKNSVSSKVAHLYQSHLLQHQVESNIVDLADLPQDFVFTALYDNNGRNSKFNKFLDQLRASEKYVFIIPEYNGSFPGVLKAFIDGMEYPNSFRDKKCALVGISSGMQGAGLALSHMTDIFNYLGMHVLALKPKLARIEQNFDGEEVTDKLYGELLEEQVKKLLEF
ncbi:NAD(P)H-dependent oxidoreductase [Marivirga harenae]|uniref:NADPH-dependent FMN reductase n=1 Tax=Marivirga harenae TaxID=2010992 RepID=UPI0026E0C849|nr:NAD(P)H-dependent oxidoreductase [Marivirga harenae]WKV13970.1 NAD(P)H-dependent oxidoreductase [Marivirga harenae]|tara:strand:+ start:292420 stop:292944 length:525 start_codon:yes stop_codon:yes gene_type:complete